MELVPAAMMAAVAGEALSGTRNLILLVLSPLTSPHIVPTTLHTATAANSATPVGVQNARANQVYITKSRYVTDTQPLQPREA
jgi:hypothetical protein